jgi:hypothetical protein
MVAAYAHSTACHPSTERGAILPVMNNSDGHCKELAEARRQISMSKQPAATCQIRSIRRNYSRSAPAPTKLKGVTETVT